MYFIMARALQSIEHIYLIECFALYLCQRVGAIYKMVGSKYKMVGLYIKWLVAIYRILWDMVGAIYMKYWPHWIS